MQYNFVIQNRLNCCDIAESDRGTKHSEVNRGCGPDCLLLQISQVFWIPMRHLQETVDRETVDRIHDPKISST